MKTNKELIDEIDVLIEEKKFSSLRNEMLEKKAIDLSEIFEELPPEKATLSYRLLPKELAAEVFVEMSSEMQEKLINSFSDFELRQIISELYHDDTADIIEEMPANVVRRILKNSSSETRRKVNELLKYPESSAGSIMTTEYVSLKQSMTVKEAFAYIREVAINKETIYTCYVVDSNRHLIGIVTAKTLLLASEDEIIKDIMEQNVIFAYTLDDREQVARQFDRYDYLALPVVDTEQRLVGIITVDDAIDVLQEETEEDFEKMAAITPIEKPYLKTKTLKIWQARTPWLLLLMISATFTGLIISSFEEALQSIAVLTVFIPMIMGTGGNSGSQASVTVIRGLSTGEIEFRDFFRILWKEFKVALLCGLTLAVVTLVKVILIDRYMMGNADVTLSVALVVSITLFATIFCAKLIGCVLPLVAKKLGFDPAVMASPFITTIIDAVSLIVYFGVASSILNM